MQIFNIVALLGVASALKLAKPDQTQDAQPLGQDGQQQADLELLPVRDSEDKPERDSEDKPERDSEDKPERDSEDKPERDSEDKPERDGDKERKPKKEGRISLEDVQEAMWEVIDADGNDQLSQEEAATVLEEINGWVVDQWGPE